MCATSGLLRVWEAKALPLLLPAFSTQHPLSTWLGPLLSPGTTLWVLLTLGSWGSEDLVWAEEGSLAFDRVEEYLQRS